VILEELRIRNLATIAEVEVRFSPHLNLLTGETGAGKSIVVDALKLLAGDRSDTDLIRHGEETLTVEALFGDLSEDMGTLLAARGIDSSDGRLVLKREIHRDKPNRIWANGSPVALKVLSEFGAALIAVHGQAEQLSLLDEAYRLSLVDALDGLDTSDVAGAFARLTTAEQKLEQLKGRAAERARLLDYLVFAVKEIDGTDLKPGEEETLKTQKVQLKKKSEILEALSFSLRALDNEDASLIGALKEVEHRLEPLAALMSTYREAAGQVQTARENLEDVSFFLDRELSQVESPEVTLDDVENRLAAIDRLKKKYAPTVEEILARRATLEQERRELEDVDTALADSEEARREAEKTYLGLAKELSRERAKAARTLQKRVQALLPSLALEKAVFEVKMTPDAVRRGPTGIDGTQFMILTNPGEGMLPLEKMASGGELSRIQLALQQAVQSRRGKVMVFDEVDQGIGGKAATAVGKMLKDLGAQDQILCVSHLPQVAVWAHTHLKVEKGAEKGRTVTRLSALSGKEREAEIARMLGGEEFSTALTHARKLLSLPKGPGDSAP
jgi:DNA repair protein RecN (Recombination protein N)